MESVYRPKEIVSLTDLWRLSIFEYIDLYDMIISLAVEFGKGDIKEPYFFVALDRLKPRLEALRTAAFGNKVTHIETGEMTKLHNDRVHMFRTFMRFYKVYLRSTSRPDKVKNAHKIRELFYKCPPTKKKLSNQTEISSYLSELQSVAIRDKDTGLFEAMEDLDVKYYFDAMMKANDRYRYLRGQRAISHKITNNPTYRPDVVRKDAHENLVLFFNLIEVVIELKQTKEFNKFLAGLDLHMRNIRNIATRKVRRGEKKRAMRNDENIESNDNIDTDSSLSGDV